MIHTQQLGFQHPGGPALQFEDVSLAQGGTLLVGGASGSGKSTWLALIAGLLTGTGSVVVAGQALGDLGQVAGDAWRAKTIGFLPQKLHLSAALSVKDNLALAQWASSLAQDESAIEAALNTLGVAELAARKPSQLSGGQAQRVALARAVLLTPKVILADEPTASLDDAACAASLDLLQATCQRLNASLVIATHDSRVGSFFQSQKALRPADLLHLKL
jgi:putative ABC transport system ATP-binding protein